MDDRVQDAREDEDPGQNDLHEIRLARDQQEGDQDIEEDRQLDLVAEVVGGLARLLRPAVVQGVVLPLRAPRSDRPLAGDHRAEKHDEDQRHLHEDGKQDIGCEHLSYPCLR